MKTSIKLKFRPSVKSDKEGTLYYQLIHERRVKQIKTHYKIKSNEWDEQSEAIVVPVNDNQRKHQVESVERCVKWDIQRLEKIVEEYEDKGLPYGLNHIADAYQKLCQKHSLFSFMEDVIAQYQRHGQIRTSETYLTTLNSFKRFRMDVDIMLEEINSELLLSYEYYLKMEGVSPNTISFYMHRLRAVYNRAVEQELVEQRFPFKRVKTSIEKTVKRAIPVKFIRKLKSLDLSDSPSKAFARDMFLFSFYTRGMSFIDMAYLKKANLRNGILTYRRSKTGQSLTLQWEPCMQQILDRYPSRSSSEYLFPIICYSQSDKRNQYKNALARINRSLKELGRTIGLSAPLTMYVARHSWASIAHSEGIPLSVISQGMGHESEKTTRIYLASLDNAVIDKANRKILQLV
ncbi:MAG: site-specific integrase [Bacteroidaceae bacterium]|nr:site-specific integrase [Bacteroidaceae bacterium]